MAGCALSSNNEGIISYLRIRKGSLTVQALSVLQLPQNKKVFRQWRDEGGIHLTLTVD